MRAMIHWQLGEKTEARASFDGAIEQLKSLEPRYEENLKQGILTFPLPVQLKRQQAEAAALLGVTPPASNQHPSTCGESRGGAGIAQVHASTRGTERRGETAVT